MKLYTGVGSRQTPSHILDLMKHVGRVLARNGFTLRSGGADGADTAFEEGCKFEKGARQIYLPWPGFNGRNQYALNRPTAEAMNLAKMIHPNWNACSSAARSLHARNVHQVLGADLKSPSKFLLYWTPQGLRIGGTATALALAYLYKIPMFYLGTRAGYNSFIQAVTKMQINPQEFDPWERFDGDHL